MVAGLWSAAVVFALFALQKIAFNKRDFGKKLRGLGNSPPDGMRLSRSTCDEGFCDWGAEFCKSARGSVSRRFLMLSAADGGRVDEYDARQGAKLAKLESPGAN
jgi:hypothetical protein